MELGEEILEDKIQLAVLHFQTRNYAKCVALYNEVVGQLTECTRLQLVRVRRHYGLSDAPAVGVLAHPKLVSVLDQRAATYEKLGKLNMARKDAERAVATDPANCKGHLRLAKVCLKEGDTVGAYKVLQKGIYVVERAMTKYKVEVSPKLLAQLKAQYKDLNSALKRQPNAAPVAGKSASVSGKSSSFTGLQKKLDEMLPLKRLASASGPVKRVKRTTDPIDRFPMDVVERIFSRLPFGNVLRCHLVCKDWYAILTSLPRLYEQKFLLKHRITAPEYFQGLRLMKKVLMYLYSKSISQILLWSTYNIVHLNRILENIISDTTLKLRKLHLLNKDLCMELLLNRLEKCKWNYQSLQSVTQLRLGVNSSPIIEACVFLLFPQLVSFDLLMVGKLLRGTNAHLIPAYSDGYNQFSKQAKQVTSHESLERLNAVNHPGLTREHQQVRPNERTFDPSPPFLNIRFPALRELNLTNYDFLNLETNFGKFLADCVHLKELYLENNEEMSLRKLLVVLRLYDVKFTLDKLTMREKQEDRAYSLNEFDSEGFECLSALSHLDLYGTFISNRGLLKLLGIANAKWNLKSLNLGSASHVFFRNDKIISGRDALNFSQILEIVPGLRALSLPELDLDNLSLKLLHQDLVNTVGKDNCQLKKLDLSFCHLIDGIGLMNLVNASYKSDAAKSLTFEELTVDGLSINKETLNLLTKRQLIETIKNDPFKTKWRQYGVNSYMLDLLS